MANFFTDNDDLLFQFDHGIDWNTLAALTEHGYRAQESFESAKEAVGFYREMALASGEMAAERIAPKSANIDREESHLIDGEVREGAAMKSIFTHLREIEMHRLCIPRELGGLNAPLLLYFLVGEMIARGDVGAMTHYSFHGGMAMAMLVYSINEGSTTFDAATSRITACRFSEQIGEIARGEAWGCMDITEPDAGSDMAALRTRAEQNEAGHWFVSGQKIFISSGHAKYHFVIARTETPKDNDDMAAGLAGLSMFLVPAWEDLADGTRRRFVTVDRVEEKLGHHGSVTAALSFERAPAMLIGKRGEGFKYMLTLMNNARLGVSFESIGLCENALRMATAYAQGRRSMGKTIDRHEMIADYLDEMQTDIQALRAFAVQAAFHEEVSQKVALAERFGTTGRSDTVDQLIARKGHHRRTARRFTPLLKYLAAEKAVEHARRCVQIHGGVGYTRDYGAEKLLRDAMVLPIYEGTSQIQSLMAMKDTLGGIIARPGAFLARMGRTRVTAMTSRDELERRVARLSLLSLSAQQHLTTRTAVDKIRTLSTVPVRAWRRALTHGWDPKRDFALAMLHAERLTRLLADEAVAEVLFEQSRAHPERREVLARWLDRAEIRSRSLHEEITTTGARLIEKTRSAGPSPRGADLPASDAAAE